MQKFPVLQILCDGRILGSSQAFMQNFIIFSTDLYQLADSFTPDELYCLAIDTDSLEKCELLRALLDRHIRGYQKLEKWLRQQRRTHIKHTRNNAKKQHRKCNRENKPTLMPNESGLVCHEAENQNRESETTEDDGEEETEAAVMKCPTRKDDEIHFKCREAIFWRNPYEYISSI